MGMRRARFYALKSVFSRRFYVRDSDKNAQKHAGRAVEKDTSTAFMNKCLVAMDTTASF